MDLKEMDVSRKGNRYNTFSVSRIFNKVVRGICSCGSNCHYSYRLFGRSDMETRCAMEIIHDRAAEFLPDVLQDTTSIMGLTQLPTSGGHPQTDELVEQLNKTLKAMLSKVVSKGGKDWG